jgi:hypothetical protein
MVLGRLQHRQCQDDARFGISAVWCEGASFARSAVICRSVYYQAAATGKTVALSGFVFFLPTVFQWSRSMATVPTSIRWALDAINAFFSTLLLLGSIATIRVALSPRRDTMIIWGMALFWVFNTAYQLLWPFPQRAVSWGTLGFAALMVASYTLTLWLGRDASAGLASNRRGAVA